MPRLLFSVLFVGLFSLLHVLGQNAPTNITLPDIQSAFTNFSVVPDVIPTFRPTALLSVLFNDTAANTSLPVAPGENLTITQTTFEPKFFLTANASSDAALLNATFVLALVDPDAPTPQNASLSQFRHLLAPNFRLASHSANSTLLVNSTPAITEYQTPGPPNGSDPHRYVFLLFVQNANFTKRAAALVNASTPRNNFNISAFANKTGLGRPVAGNFFFTGPDNSTNATTGTNGTTGTGTTGTGTTGGGPVGGGTGTGSPSGAAGSVTGGGAPGPATTTTAGARRDRGMASPVGISLAMMMFGLLL